MRNGKSSEVWNCADQSHERKMDVMLPIRAKDVHRASRGVSQAKNKTNDSQRATSRYFDGLLFFPHAIPCAHARRNFYFDGFVSFSPLFCAYTKCWATLWTCRRDRVLGWVRPDRVKWAFFAFSSCMRRSQATALGYPAYLNGQHTWALKLHWSL